MKRAGGPRAPSWPRASTSIPVPPWLDSRGYLHMVMGGHNSPLQYQRSLRPHDASAWTPVQAFGRNTYPVLMCGPDDTLHLTARDGHNGMELWEKPPAGPWQSRADWS